MKPTRILIFNRNREMMRSFEGLVEKAEKVNAKPSLKNRSIDYDTKIVRHLHINEIRNALASSKVDHAVFHYVPTEKDLTLVTSKLRNKDSELYIFDRLQKVVW